MSHRSNEVIFCHFVTRHFRSLGQFVINCHFMSSLVTVSSSLYVKPCLFVDVTLCHILSLCQRHFLSLCQRYFLLTVSTSLFVTFSTSLYITVSTSLYATLCHCDVIYEWALTKARKQIFNVAIFFQVLKKEKKLERNKSERLLQIKKNKVAFHKTSCELLKFFLWTS